MRDLVWPFLYPQPPHTRSPTHTHTHTHTYARTHAHTYLHTHTHTHTHVCTHSCTYTHHYREGRSFGKTCCHFERPFWSVSIMCVSSFLSSVGQLCSVLLVVTPSPSLTSHHPVPSLPFHSHLFSSWFIGAQLFKFLVLLRARVSPWPRATRWWRGRYVSLCRAPVKRGDKSKNIGASL